jgi:hypothetical protein
MKENEWKFFDRNNLNEISHRRKGERRGIKMSELKRNKKEIERLKGFEK